MRNPEEKIVSLEKATALASQFREQGKKIVTTNGCFDLLHLGHLNYLREARLLGDLLWIGLNSDSSVSALKGPSRPLQKEQVRALQLAALEAVDFVTVFSESTPEVFLSAVSPAIHVKGGDYRPEDLPERGVVERKGGKIQCLPFTPGFSTTGLIQAIRDSEGR